MDQICSRCGLPILPEMNFCSRCGEKIRGAPPLTTLRSQISAYFVSLFIPPFGLWYTYKYLRKGGKKEKTIGYATIVLTVIGLVFLVWATNSFMNSVNEAKRSLQGLSF